MRDTGSGRTRVARAVFPTFRAISALVLALVLATNTAGAEALGQAGQALPGGGNAAGVSAQIAAVDQQLAAIPQRQSALAAQQKSLDARAGAFNQRAKGALSRLEAVSKQIDQHNSVVRSYPGGAAPPAIASSLNAKAASLNSQKTALQAEANSISAEGDAIESEEARLGSQQTQLEGERASLTAQRQQLLGQLASTLLASFAAPPQTVAQAQGGDPVQPPSSPARQAPEPDAGGDPVSRKADGTALDAYARDRQVDVDKRPITATLSPDSVRALPAEETAQLPLNRTFDGLVRKPGGTYKGLSVATSDQQSAGQQAFNRAVTNGGAVASQDGEQITIDEVEQVPAPKPEDCSTPNSFVPGTLVLLADGSSRPIEQLTPGDLVQATDPVSGRTAAEPVLRLITDTGVKHLNRLTVSAGQSGGTITATEDHPFWNPARRAWVDADELRPGQVLTGLRGSAPVQVTTNDAAQATLTVHNLSVSDLHTYYVLAGRTPVLVHNSDECINWSAKSVKTWGHTFRTHGAGAKNTRSLTDRARRKQHQQGQWLDDDAAAAFLKGIHTEGAGARIVRIPDGLGQVIMPDGSIVQAREATLVPRSNGLYKTGFPIIGPN